jgi:hypothetical protein
LIAKIKKLSEQNRILSQLSKILFHFTFAFISICNEFTGLLRIHNIGGKCYRSLLNYKNRYLGNRCFIIATGPSIILDDLNKMINEYTFGMNSICKIYDEIEFRPTFYGIQDIHVYKNLKKYINNYYCGKKNIFISSRIKKHFHLDSNWNIFPLFTAYNAFDRWFNNRYKSKISDNIYRCVYDGFSITISLIQIAMYMGFKQIYLVGADCDFQTENRLHFVEHNVLDTTLDTAAERNIAGYEAVYKYASNNGISIFNATRGGKLELFKRVSFDDLFK